MEYKGVEIIYDNPLASNAAWIAPEGDYQWFSINDPSKSRWFRRYVKQVRRRAKWIRFKWFVMNLVLMAKKKKGCKNL